MCITKKFNRALNHAFHFNLFQSVDKSTFYLLLYLKQGNQWVRIKYATMSERECAPPFCVNLPNLPVSLTRRYNWCQLSTECASLLSEDLTTLHSVCLMEINLAFVGAKNRGSRSAGPAWLYSYHAFSQVIPLICPTCCFCWSCSSHLQRHDRISLPLQNSLCSQWQVACCVLQIVRHLQDWP